MPYKQDRYEVRGVDTAVLTAGDGEPIVFLHGGGTIEGYDCLLPLAERYRLVIPYHPGFPPSGDDPRVTGIRDFVPHYVELFEQLGIDSPVLVGHSLGGYVAAAFAVEHGERIRRLVLHAPFGADVPDHPPANLGTLAPGEVYRLLTNEPSVFEGRVPDPPDEAFLAARAQEGGMIGRVFGGLPGPFDPDLFGSLDRVTTPTLILWSDDDKIIPVEHALVWDAALPNSRLRIWEGRGHLLFHEEPEAVAAIGEFAAE